MLAPERLADETDRAFAAVARALGMDAWPEVPVRWNRRLRRAGRALIDMPGDRFDRAVIELSPRYFEVYPEDLYGILVHEAVHVALAVQGRPFGHGPAFRQACAEAGGLQHSRWLPGRIYRYRCPVCASVLDRRRPVGPDRWCAPCVEAAQAEGRDPYVTERALVLAETTFQGREGGC